MRRRRHRRAPELTPLIDVLFILLFASLIQARSAVQQSQAQAREEPEVRSDDSAPDAGPIDAGPIDARSPDAGPIDAGPIDAGPTIEPEPEYLVRSRELATAMAGSVFGRHSFVVDIRSTGYVTGVTGWLDGQEMSRRRVRHRLTRVVLPNESDRRLDRLPPDALDRLCPFVRTTVHLSDEQEMLILVMLDQPLDELDLALSRQLEADLDDCFDSARGVVILVQPEGIRP